ncbi:MAG TPA: sugar transferase [Acidimicrobiales bacterium]|nr:sugar transferase [Acidimicrobiales bacterium]
MSIDELPQLWNVLVGDMSLVGPRPERPHFVDQFSPTVRGYKDRHRLPVGLTGLAQVNGLRGDTSIEQRARLDNYYIEHWSPWQDILILVSTLGEVWRNARSDWYDRRSRVHEVSRPSPPDPDRAKALDGAPGRPLRLAAAPGTPAHGALAVSSTTTELRRVRRSGSRRQTRRQEGPAREPRQRRRTVAGATPGRAPAPRSGRRGLFARTARRRLRRQ